MGNPAKLQARQGSRPLLAVFSTEISTQTVDMSEIHLGRLSGLKNKHA
jgi:hypothetical protein